MRVALLLLAAALLAAGPGMPPAPDIAGIAKRGSLRVAMVASDQPPFFERDARGQLRGIDVDLADGLAQALGVRVAFDRQPQSFDAAAAAVASGRDDIAITKLSVTLGRARSLHFSRPYVHLRQALLLNRVLYARAVRGRTPWDLVHDFHGSIGVLAGSSYVRQAQRDFPHAAIRTFDSWPQLVRSVREGKIFAAMRDELTMREAVAENPRDELIFTTLVLSDTVDDIAAAVRPDEPTLLALVNDYIALHGMPYNADDVLERGYR